MKKIEERPEIELHISSAATGRAYTGVSHQVAAWGDDMPIVRLGSEVAYVNRHGWVFESVEAAFVAASSNDGCRCVGTQSAQNYVQALNKIAQFLALVALGRSPTEIASLIFHGEMFIFETFNSSMEDRGLVEHVPGEMVDGYHPLDLTEEGEAGLRMCLQSELVDMPFERPANIEDVLEPLQIASESEDEVRKLPVPARGRDMRATREIAASLRAKRKPVRPSTRRTPAVE